MKIVMSSKRNWIIVLLIVSNFIMAFRLKSDSNEKNPIDENQKVGIDTTTMLLKDTTVLIEKEIALETTNSIVENKESAIKICKYDAFIQKHARSIDWDWRLIASIIYKEIWFATWQ